MSSQSVAENITDSIINHLKTNIATYLSEIRTDHNDGIVTTEVPVSYLTYDNAIGYKTPAIFVLINDIDYRLTNGPNMINAAAIVFVSCVLEDRNQRLLTYKCFRYNDALHKCLSRAHLVDQNKNIQNIIKVMRSQFGSAAPVKSSVDSVFRKEVMLTLEVEHYEKEN